MNFVPKPEAAKVIENVRRNFLRKNLVKPSDIPLRSSRIIALMNELTLIFHRMGLNTGAVLDAAGTKWNFHRYTPGLVGGHCIPVDPYYPVHKAEELEIHPQVILAGRAINDSMPGYVALIAIKGLNDVGKVIKGSKVLIDFFTKNRVKTALRVGFCSFLRPKAQQKGVTVFEC